LKPIHIAAPVFCSDGAEMAAISVSVPSGRFTAERQAALCLVVQPGADRLSRILGYHPREP
jgi:DNA-binding IclR family transcriptional regulator